ncbi:sulfurtransferase [uncultured Erythrobacter sp.]|uniref:sulfurtransferase n=1 Tax=uncultured Erythrobacter sp. TaxID=263913 RepID=UPI002612D030|nr:sulfurtransferase [uncultured Erythrobacter sp.]
MDSLVSTRWLAENLGAPNLVILDASRHLPAAGRDPRAEYDTAHIPGARFLDLAALVDTTSSVPQALPTPRQLADTLAGLGVGDSDRVVIYDDSAVKTSARAWFTLVAHGFENVAILDGGLAKWRGEDRQMESTLPEFGGAAPVSLNTATRVRTKANLVANIDTQAEQVLDARGADRVFGTGIDPVHGGENGRIPGSLNLPFGQVYNADGTFKPTAELRAAFEAAGVDLDQPVVTTCGSGVTASVLLFALHLIGKHDTALYDGSWMEWSADPDTRKAQGLEEVRPE